jgi:hypothetical protein
VPASFPDIAHRCIKEMITLHIEPVFIIKASHKAEKIISVFKGELGKAAIG